MGTQARVYRKRRKVKRKELSDREIDQRRAGTAYFKLGTLLQDLVDWSADLHRFRKKGVNIKNEEMVLASMLECSTALNKAIKVFGNEKAEKNLH